MMKRRRVLTVLAVLGFCLVTAGTLSAIGKIPGLSRVKLTVRNTDPAQTLRFVTVKVTGATYMLGDLQPGQSATVRLRPKGESDVRVQHLAPGDDGGVVESRVECHLEPRSHGVVRASVNSAGLAHADFNVRP